MLCLLIHVRFVPLGDIGIASQSAVCFSYLISQVALWLTITAGRPPTVS
jgi:hypothetical protein